jgi:hypothetical protein
MTAARPPTVAGRRLAIVRALLTVCAFEFFGPILRDYSPSHALNPDWVGHARVHLVWLLAFMFFSGLANLYLIWFRQPREPRNLWLSVTWQACNLGGFWVAYLLAPHYAGVIAVPGIHVQVLGIDENLFAFTVLSIVLTAAALLLLAATRPERPEDHR